MNPDPRRLYDVTTRPLRCAECGEPPTVEMGKGVILCDQHASEYLAANMSALVSSWKARALREVVRG